MSPSSSLSASIGAPGSPSLSLHCPFNSCSGEIFKSLVNGSPSNTMVLCSAFGPCNLSCSSTSPHCNLLNLLFGTCSLMNNKKGNKNNKMIQVYQIQGSQGHSVILCLLWEDQGADLQGGEHGNSSDQAWKAWGCQNISKHVKTTYAKLPNCVFSYVLVIFRIFPWNCCPARLFQPRLSRSNPGKAEMNKLNFSEKRQILNFAALW